MDRDDELERLIIGVKQGDDSSFSALCDKYKPLMVTEANKTYRDESVRSATGYEDLLQEGAIALYRAALRFDLTQDKVSFGLYAKICIRNRMISQRRRIKSRIGKTSPDAERESAKSEKKPVSKLSGRYVDPETLSRTVEKALSDFEKKVFALYARQYSYKEIAAHLSRSEKAIDNAIYRIKCKLKKYI